MSSTGATLLFAWVALARAAAAADGPPANPVVVLETELGTVRIEVYLDRAPFSAGAFLAHVEAGKYDGAAFYRTVTPDNQPSSPVRIEVVQGGLGWEDQPGALPPVAHETTEATGIRHLDGTVSLARAEPGTASSEFFVCVGDQPELDFGGRRNPDGQGFAAFGRVVEGMEVVRALHRRPAEGQLLTPPVTLRRASRARGP